MTTIVEESKYRTPKKGRAYKNNENQKKGNKNKLGITAITGIEEAKGDVGKTAFALLSTFLGTSLGVLAGSLIKRGSFGLSLPITGIGIYKGSHFLTSIGAGMMYGGAVSPSKEDMAKIKEKHRNPDAKILNIPQEKERIQQTLNIHLTNLQQQFFLDSFNQKSVPNTEKAPDTKQEIPENTNDPKTEDKNLAGIEALDYLNL